MSKRITIQLGDYILLSDIPNEQVFNLVKECFGNAGFYSTSIWGERNGWSAFYTYDNAYSCFTMEHNYYCIRQLSLSDVFNSTNGGFDWGSSDVALFETNWTDATRTTRNYITIERIVEQPTMFCHNIPPVGTVCEYSLSNGRTWYVCKIVSHHNLVLDCPHIETEDCNGLQVVDKDLVIFRPLRTDREKVIDKAFSKLTEFRSAEQVLGDLYDAGMLKGI